MNKRSIDHLRRLVGAASVSSKDPAIDTSNRAAADVVAELLDDAGFEVELLDVAGMPGKVNVAATAGPNEPGEGLLLAGHIDTVPTTPADWDTDPWTLTEKDGSLYGLGACDMKGFFGVLAEALPAIDLARLRRPLRVWATADEECGMEGAEQIARSQPASAAALVGEPTGLVPVYGHKGALAEEFICTGKAGHASNPAGGANALEALSLVMNALREDFAAELESLAPQDDFNPPQPTMSFGMCQAGDSFNRIPDHARIWVDRRLMPGATTAQVRERMRKAASAAVAGLAGITLECRPLIAGFSAMRTPPDAPIVQAGSRLSGIAPATAAYATEAAYYAGAGMEVLIMGAGSVDVIHQPNEHVPIAQIDAMAKTTIGLVEQFCIAEGKPQ